MTTFESVCLLFNISIEANSVDPDQTALGFVCLFVLLLYVPSQQLWSLRDSQFT